MRADNLSLHYVKAVFVEFLGAVLELNFAFETLTPQTKKLKLKNHVQLFVYYWKINIITSTTTKNPDYVDLKDSMKRGTTPDALCLKIQLEN